MWSHDLAEAALFNDAKGEMSCRLLTYCNLIKFRVSTCYISVTIRNDFPGNVQEFCFTDVAFVHSRFRQCTLVNLIDKRLEFISITSSLFW